MTELLFERLWLRGVLEIQIGGRVVVQKNGTCWAWPPLAVVSF